MQACRGAAGCDQPFLYVFTLYLSTPLAISHSLLGKKRDLGMEEQCITSLSSQADELALQAARQFLLQQASGLNSPGNEIKQSALQGIHATSLLSEL
ncbi:hypothetical protein JOQ06_014856, partial [Pogonophryne albipinna]